MPCPMPAPQLLDRHFLDMRCRVLDLAAALDRIERSEGGRRLQDARLELLHAAISILSDGEPDRAARVQMLFSDPYDAAWKRPTAQG